MCLFEFINWFANLLTDFIMGTIDFFYIPIAEMLERQQGEITTGELSSNTMIGLLLLIVVGLMISLSCRD